MKRISGLVLLFCALHAGAQSYPAGPVTPVGKAPDQFRGSVAASIEASRRIAADSGLEFD